MLKTKEFWEQVLKEYLSYKTFECYICYKSATFHKCWAHEPEFKDEVKEIARKFLIKTGYDFEIGVRGILFSDMKAEWNREYVESQRNLRTEFLNYIIQSFEQISLV